MSGPVAMTVAVTLDQFARSALPALWRTSWQAAVLALLVLLVQAVFAKRLAARWRYNLWLLVLLRLLLPVTPAARFSVFNVARDLPQRLPDAIPIAPKIAAAAMINPSVSSATRNINPATLLAILWLIGAALLLLRILAASAKLSRVVRRMRPVERDDISALLRSCAVEMGVDRAPILLESDDLAAPALMGFWRPRLLLPSHVLSDFSPAELRLIFLHELAHLRRRDVAVNWLIAILQAIHWFNPILWLAFARMRSDRELAADELVLAHSSGERPSDRTEYGNTIVKLLQTLSSPRPALPGTVGILERAHLLRRRITMIAHFKGLSKQWTLVAAALSFVLAAIALTDAVQVNAVRAASAATRPAGVLSPGTPAPSPSSQPADVESTYAMFHTRLANLSFNKIALDDVVNFLRDVTGLNINVGWKALEAAGIDRKTPVDLALHDATLEQVLRQICKQASGGSVQLGFGIDGNALYISSMEEIDRSPRARAYDVQDLIASATTRPAPEGDIAAADELIRLIVSNVASETWRDNGGTVGSITPFGHRLVINTTDMHHLEVDSLLAELRRKH